MKSLFLLLSLLPASAAPLLKNGDFEAKLVAPWVCEEGRMKREDSGNRLLRITPDGGAFSLTQNFQWPAERKRLALTLRLKAEGATEKDPMQIRVRLIDANGNSTITPTVTVEESGKWIQLKWTLEKPETETRSLMLESNRGAGPVLIDDVALK